MSIKTWWKELQTVFDLTVFVNLRTFCFVIEILDFKVGFGFHLPDFILYSKFLNKTKTIWMNMTPYGKKPNIKMVSQDLSFNRDLMTGISIEICKNEYPLNFDMNLLGLRYGLSIYKETI